MFFYWWWNNTALKVHVRWGNWWHWNKHDFYSIIAMSKQMSTLSHNRIGLFTSRSRDITVFITWCLSCYRPRRFASWSITRETPCNKYRYIPRLSVNNPSFYYSVLTQPIDRRLWFWWCGTMKNTGALYWWLLYQEYSQTFFIFNPPVSTE